MFFSEIRGQIFVIHIKHALDDTLLPMSYDQTSHHIVLPGQTGQSPCVLVCNIMEMGVPLLGKGITKFV